MGFVRLLRMGFLPRAMIKILLASACLGALTTHAALISSSVGRVGDWVVTSREVMINHLLENALYKTSAKNKVPKATLSLARTRDREFIRETTSVLLETAIYLEAESFAQSDSNLAATIETQKSLAVIRLKNDPTWKKLKPSDKEISLFVRRKIKAKDFLRFKMESASIPISDREAEEYFQNNKLKFENLPFNNFKDNIKSYLTKQQMDRRLKDWFELLQSKYRVRNLLSE